MYNYNQYTKPVKTWQPKHKNMELIIEYYEKERTQSIIQ